MSKKDYNKFAELIRNRIDSHNTWGDGNDAIIEELCIVAEELSGILLEDNPRFDRSKFLIACGVLDGNK